jgi:capsular exopolysaccharide synthesis family protein
MTEDATSWANRVLINSHELPFGYIEAYKSLRTNLQFVSVDKNIKRLLVTSAIPAEGKTTVAINLAITLAETGNKVMVIDCDLRKPSIHKYLRIKAKTIGGLTNILAEKADIDSCTAYFNDLKIYAITSGPIPPNPTELLASERMAELMGQLNEKYDYIIIDTPPVSVVADAAVLSKNSDGVIFILRQNFTKIEAAHIARKNLENVGANVIGCVFNAFNASKSNKSNAYYNYNNYNYSNK